MLTLIELQGPRPLDLPPCGGNNNDASAHQPRRGNILFHMLIFIHSAVIAEFLARPAANKIDF